MLRFTVEIFLKRNNFKAEYTFLTYNEKSFVKLSDVHDNQPYDRKHYPECLVDPKDKTYLFVKHGPNESRQYSPINIEDETGFVELFLEDYSPSCWGGHWRRNKLTKNNILLYASEYPESATSAAIQAMHNALGIHNVRLIQNWGNDILESHKEEENTDCVSLKM